jgi:peroxiredoxin Q/BCP
MAEPLNPGDPAPDFSLSAQPDGSLSLAALRGRKVVLYFYPRADTPGCTQEAMDFSRLRTAFAAAGTEVIGVSADPEAALKKFRKKHGLSVTLAADPDLETLKAYGAWAEKNMYGRKFMGIVRTTFLIDARGLIAQVWRNVRVPGHAGKVLAAAKSLDE